jgi:hypothetical protein
VVPTAVLSKMAEVPEINIDLTTLKGNKSS